MGKESEQDRIRALNEQALASERVLLAANVECLLAHIAQIQANPNWRDVRVHSARFYLAYLGGTVLRLGDLVSGWNNGRLIEDSGEGERYFLALSGTPLSGRGFAYLSNRNGDIVGERIGGGSARAAPFVTAAKEESGINRMAWSLGEVLADLGVVLPDVSISNGVGEIQWHYSLDTRSLRNTHGEILTLPSSSWSSQLDEVRKESGSKKRFEFAKGGLRSGTWDEDVLYIETHDQRRWTIGAGTVSDSAGYLVWSFSLPLPIAMLAWLVERCATDQANVVDL